MGAKATTSSSILAIIIIKCIFCITIIITIICLAIASCISHWAITKSSFGRKKQARVDSILRNVKDEKIVNIRETIITASHETFETIRKGIKRRTKGKYSESWAKYPKLSVK